MECNETAGQSPQSHQEASPVRVSDGAWFHLRYGMKGGNDERQHAFIAHSYSSLRTLLAKANGADLALFLCSKQADGQMAFRRVVAIRDVRYTNMSIFELEDGQGVLWEEDEDVEAGSVYVDIDASVCIGQRADATTP